MMSMRWLWFVMLASLAGCAPAANAPLRSPSTDYQPPAPTTSDGRVVGADSRPVEDRLAEGVSSKGAAPGWTLGKGGLAYDPLRRVGGAVVFKEEKSAASRQDRKEMRPGPYQAPTRDP